jgi:pyruvate dehydrogenase E1 component
VIAASKLLADDWGVESDLWSCTSFTELAREGQACERENRLQPTQEKKIPYVSQCLNDHPGPVVVSTDYVRLLADSIRPFIRKHCTVLGTDGFGRSDTRENLRRFFEVDRYYVTVAALNALADTGQIEATIVQQALEKYDLAASKPAPWLV